MQEVIRLLFHGFWMVLISFCLLFSSHFLNFFLFVPWMLVEHTPSACVHDSRSLLMVFQQPTWLTDILFSFSCQIMMDNRLAQTRPGWPWTTFTEHDLTNIPISYIYNNFNMMDNSTEQNFSRILLPGQNIEQETFIDDFLKHAWRAEYLKNLFICANPWLHAISQFLRYGLLMIAI